MPKKKPKGVSATTRCNLYVAIQDNTGAVLDSYVINVEPGQQPPPIPLVGETAWWRGPSGARYATIVTRRTFDSTYGSGELLTEVHVWATNVG